jgi:hypothetical protein
MTGALHGSRHSLQRTEMVRRYEYRGEDERCMQFGVEYVPADDYDELVEQYATYKDSK